MEEKSEFVDIGGILVPAPFVPNERFRLEVNRPEYPEDDKDYYTRYLNSPLHPYIILEVGDDDVNLWPKFKDKVEYPKTRKRLLRIQGGVGGNDRLVLSQYFDKFGLENSLVSMSDIWADCQSLQEGNFYTRVYFVRDSRGILCSVRLCERGVRYSGWKGGLIFSGRIGCSIKQLDVRRGYLKASYSSVLRVYVRDNDQ